MAITTEAGLIAAIAKSHTANFYKAQITAGQGGFVSGFRGTGLPEASTLATPTTTGRTLDRTSSGALSIPPDSSDTMYISKFECVGVLAQTVILADRIIEYGGLSGTLITTQSVSALSLPARATGLDDIELWMEWYTATGATASVNVTAQYTNHLGTSGRTATLVGGIPSNPGARRNLQFQLQAGDTGVQSVQSVISGTSTGTAGNFGLTLRKTLIMGGLLANGKFSQGWAETDLQVVPEDACIEMVLLQAGAANVGNIYGSLQVIQG